VGICEDEVGKIDKFFDKLLSDDSYHNIAEAYKGIDLLIFDQLNGGFDKLALLELMRQYKSTGFWSVRLYGNQIKTVEGEDVLEWGEGSYERVIVKALPHRWGDILTDDFHQKLIETGDQFFMPNNP
jgi:hypothetical protein